MRHLPKTKQLNPEDTVMHVLTVTSQSNLAELSQSLVQVLHEDSLVAVEAAGRDAVAQLLQCLNHLRGLWQSEGAELIYVANMQPKGDSDADELYVRLTLAATSQGEGAPPIEDEIADEIEAQFDEWQTLPDENNELLEKLKLHHSESPILSGGDVDAAWDQADVGDETVGGMAPTPDQDVVDELGEAVGLIYDDYEPLHTAEKLERRDEHRWELNPASADDEDEEETDL
jgi:stage V sporulation protein SpoVS